MLLEREIPDCVLSSILGIPAMMMNGKNGVGVFLFDAVARFCKKQTTGIALSFFLVGTRRKHRQIYL